MSFSKKTKSLTLAFMAAASLSGCAGLPSMSSSPVTLNDPKMGGVYTLTTKPAECIIEFKANSAQNQLVKEMLKTRDGVSSLVVEMSEVEAKLEFNFATNMVSASAAAITNDNSAVKDLLTKTDASFSINDTVDDTYAMKKILTAAEHLPATCFKKGFYHAK